MKSIVDKWYIKPNPMSRVPMGIPNLGDLNVTKATRKESKIGKGCGKSGISDSPNIMLTSVSANARILSGVGSSVRSRFSFSFVFCFRFLYHARTPERLESFTDFNYYDLKPYFTKPFLKIIVDKPYGKRQTQFGCS
jgi:hypothetical protein